MVPVGALFSLGFHADGNNRFEFEIKSKSFNVLINWIILRFSWMAENSIFFSRPVWYNGGADFNSGNLINFRLRLFICRKWNLSIFRFEDSGVGKEIFAAFSMKMIAITHYLIWGERGGRRSFIICIDPTINPRLNTQHKQLMAHPSLKMKVSSY